MRRKMNKQESWKSFKAENPVLQAFHTGLWGWERVLDCLNLARCVFASKRAAELDRAKDYRLYHGE